MKESSCDLLRLSASAARRKSSGCNTLLLQDNEGARAHVHVRSTRPSFWKERATTVYSTCALTTPHLHTGRQMHHADDDGYSRRQWLAPTPPFTIIVTCAHGTCLPHLFFRAFFHSGHVQNESSASCKPCTGTRQCNAKRPLLNARTDRCCCCCCSQSSAFACDEGHSKLDRHTINSTRFIYSPRQPLKLEPRSAASSKAK